MTFNRAVLELDADVDGDGSDETGVFTMVGNLEIQEVVDPQPILDNAAGNISSVIESILNAGEAGRRGVFVDLGAGAHVFEINFIGWEGAEIDGTSVQWGNTGDSGILTEADATGADATTQMQVFHRYLLAGTFDSFSPARLYVGEYADGTYGSPGIYSDHAPLKVMIQTNRGVRTSENPKTFDGSIQLIEVLDLSGTLDGQSILDL